MKASSTGIGFSHHSVPSLSNTATRSSGATKLSCPSWVVASTKAVTALRGFVSLQDGRGSSSEELPFLELPIGLRHPTLVMLASVHGEASKIESKIVRRRVHSSHLIGSLARPSGKTLPFLSSLSVPAA